MKRSVLFVWTVLAACNLGSGIWGLVVNGPTFLTAFSAAALVACVFNIVLEVRRGHRKAARDRDDSDIGAQFAAAFNAAVARPVGATPVAIAAAVRPDPGLTETVADVPIIAFKRCNLVWRQGGRFDLKSSHTDDVLALDADAACAPGYGMVSIWGGYPGSKPPVPHAAPGVECNCGFHAVKTADQVDANYGIVRLEVELSGRVIVHDRGYRAQHQRVLRAHVDGCTYCGEPVTAFWIGSRKGDDERLGVFPLCAAHVVDDDIVIPPAVVAARLGVPFDCAAVTA